MSWEDFLDLDAYREIFVQTGRRTEELYTSKLDICVSQISRNYEVSVHVDKNNILRKTPH